MSNQNRKLVLKSSEIIGYKKHIIDSIDVALLKV